MFDYFDSYPMPIDSNDSASSPIIPITPEELAVKLVECKYTPKLIKELLDEYIIGQDKLKKALAIAVFNHKLLAFEKDGILPKLPLKIEPSNVLIMGPTGCGKTASIKALGEILNVPVTIIDTTQITSAGYVGRDIEDIFKDAYDVCSKFCAEKHGSSNSRLVISYLETSIIYLDEVDKIYSAKEVGRDVAGRRVQESLLKILEGSTYKTKYGDIDTSKILFICGGAFPGLVDIIKNRLGKNTFGFLGKKYKNLTDDEALEHVATEDLVAFGMIPEFVGRLPIVVSVDKLTESMLIKVLNSSKNSVLKQYQAVFSLYGAKVSLTYPALKKVARIALKSQTGARALKSILYKVFHDVQYELPSKIGKKEVIIDAADIHIEE